MGQAPSSHPVCARCAASLTSRNGILCQQCIAATVDHLPHLLTLLEHDELPSKPEYLPEWSPPDQAHIRAQRSDAQAAIGALGGAPSPSPPSLAELTKRAYDNGCVANRFYSYETGTFSGLFQLILGGILPPPRTLLSRLPPPKLLTKGSFYAMCELPHQIPVGTYYWPFMPYGFAVRYVLLRDTGPSGAGLPFANLFSDNMVLYFAVRKAQPFGPSFSDPMTAGFVLLPALACFGLRLAVYQLIPPNDQVFLMRGDGTIFEMTYSDYLGNNVTDEQSRRELIAAKALLALEYPQLGTQTTLKVIETPKGFQPPELPGGAPGGAPEE